MSHHPLLLTRFFSTENEAIEKNTDEFMPSAITDEYMPSAITYEYMPSAIIDECMPSAINRVGGSVEE